jgi:hypothetical protein
VVVRDWWREVLQDWTTYAVMAGGVALLVLLIVQAEMARRRSRLKAVQGIALCYEEMSTMGERLGTPRRAHDTPAEYATILNIALEERKARWPWSSERLALVLNDTRQGVQAISRMYEWASYGELSMPEAQRGIAERQWNDLQRKLRRLRLFSTSSE